MAASYGVTCNHNFRFQGTQLNTLEFLHSQKSQVGMDIENGINPWIKTSCLPILFAKLLL